jgi:hypothetical protein
MSICKALDHPILYVNLNVRTQKGKEGLIQETRSTLGIRTEHVQIASQMRYRWANMRSKSYMITFTAAQSIIGRVKHVMLEVDCDICEAELWFLLWGTQHVPVE